jgi:hypothetical protein
LFLIGGRKALEKPVALPGSILWFQNRAKTTDERAGKDS